MMSQNIIASFGEVLKRNSEQKEEFQNLYKENGYYGMKNAIYQASVLDFSLRSNKELDSIIAEVIDGLNLGDLIKINEYLEA
jgi:hypothetical protein